MGMAKCALRLICVRQNSIENGFGHSMRRGNMVAIRTGKYSGVAVFVSLAVPLELFAGSAQPHVETEVRQPGYTLVAPSISGSNVAAQQVSNTFEPKTSAPSRIVYAAIPDSFSASTSICRQPHRSLSPSEIARTRCAKSSVAFHLRGHSIRGQC